MATATTSRRQSFKTLATSVTKFAIVGGIGFIVDVSVFNLLRATLLSPENVTHGPLIAKIISVILAILTNWLGNRYWTFRQHRRVNGRAEIIEFFIASLITMPISLLCLWVSHYLLGYTSQLADNISTNIIGTLLGSVARYLLYRNWVFRADHGQPATNQTVP